MKAQKKSRVSLDNWGAVALLMNRQENQFLVPFMQEELSVAEAADILEVEFQRMYRKVKRLEGAGLLVQTRSAPRKGRTVRYYQAVAEEFFAPAQLLPLEQVLLQVEQDLAPKFFHHLVKAILGENKKDLGTRFFLLDETRIAIRLALGSSSATPEHSSASYSMWRELSLDYSTAKALEKELVAVLERYANYSGKDTYLIRLGLTPVTNE
jgi:predicted transcriptional regulator